MEESLNINNKNIDFTIKNEKNVIKVGLDDQQYVCNVAMLGDQLTAKSDNDHKLIDYFQDKDSHIIWIDDEEYIIKEINLVYEENILSEENVVAPMPGVIKEILVTSGESVEQGETLIILESMKISNELKASKKCTIKNVLVKVGDQVGGSDLLVETE